jgi:Cytochrome c7 and related cytochrome c
MFLSPINGLCQSTVIASYKYLVPTALRKLVVLLRVLAVTASLSTGCCLVLNIVAAQTRHPNPVSKPTSTTQAAPRGSAAKYSAFLHSSDKHKSLACNACHKLPTAWTAKRDFPDAADFPDHDACVHCHRQQFFTRQAFAGAGPTICTVCHVRAAPREDVRFAFGKPNNAGQAAKPKDERQFTIEFPHDKHQSVIASLRRSGPSENEPRFVGASFRRFDDKPKPDYNNCTICHQPNNTRNIVPLVLPADASSQPNRYFKTMPHSHDSCFNCHWKNQKPTSDDCAGCHKPAATFIGIDSPPRKSLMFSHEGGKDNHVAECTTCHINITRASTLKGLTPDVPITACATCHKDNKKITYPKITTIEDEFGQFKKTSNCTYCHTSDVGKKKPPASHEAAVQ